MKKESEVTKETPGMAEQERRMAARLSTSGLKRREERILPCAMPPKRTWDKVPHRRPHDTKIEETDKSGSNQKPSKCQ